MGKPTALIFRGQPAQHAGIGRELYESVPYIRYFFDHVREVGKEYYSGDPLRLTFQDEASQEDLSNVFLAHASILATNHALFTYLKNKAPNLEFKAVAGHSLGQVNAFVAAGALGFKDATDMVLEGGKLLHEYSLQGNGGLVSVMHSNGDIGVLLNHFNGLGVYVALDNSENNIIFGGPNEVISEAVTYAREHRIHARRIGSIQGPFHTIYVKEPANQMKPLLERVQFNDAVLPVYANTTADKITDAGQFRRESHEQISMPVRWRDTVEHMARDGIERFVLIDPAEQRLTLLPTLSADGREVIVVNGISTLERAVKSLAE
jgi:[acyl-carrier-protein] S-malonyltransferase